MPRAPLFRPVLPDVVDEHLEEIGFLSVQRRKMLFSAEVGCRGLTAIDGRLEAHRDGVRVAGHDGVAIAKTRLAERDPWQIAAAATVWIADGSPTAADVAERLDGAEESDVAVWREAVRRAPPRVVMDLASTGMADASSRALALAVDAAGWHGFPLPAPPESLVERDDAQVRAATARALGAGGSAPTPRAVGFLEALARDSDRTVSRVGLWSRLLVERDRSLGQVRDLVASGGADAFAIQALGLLGDREDVDRVLPWIAREETRCAAIRALGHLGSVEIVELLLGLLASEDLPAAFAAGDALETLVGPLPPPPRRGLPRERDAGPLPVDADGAARWWNERAATFDAGTRWHRGQPYPGPLRGEPPMERLWRWTVAGSGDGPAWLRREVPDGFFEAVPTFEARPGE